MNDVVRPDEPLVIGVEDQDVFRLGRKSGFRFVGACGSRCDGQGYGQDNPAFDAVKKTRRYVHPDSSDGSKAKYHGRRLLPLFCRSPRDHVSAKCSQRAPTYY